MTLKITNTSFGIHSFLFDIQKVVNLYREQFCRCANERERERECVCLKFIRCLETFDDPKD